jgi:hypothetical protein
MFDGHWGALENMIVDTCINIREGINGLLVIVRDSTRHGLELHHTALGSGLHGVKFEISYCEYAIAKW